MSGQRHSTIAIIGGGLSGAAVADRLAQEPAAAAFRVVVIEPRAELGRGVAYSTSDPDHRLNVPHPKMSLRSDDPDHYARWLRSADAPALRSGAQTASGQIFAPRSVFGTYVARTLAPHLADGRIQHVRASADGLCRSGDGFLVSLSEGSTVQADAVVLAVTHPSPVIPQTLAPLAATPFLLSDPFAPGALDAVRGTETVLIVGAGLTSADILATLDRRRHTGPITVLSRHGLRPKPHGPAQAETANDFATHPETSARALLARVRRALRADLGVGLTWHATFDRLRAQGPAIWAALPPDERRRFLRHLRSLWDVHRFRIAPQTFDIVTGMEDAGRVRFMAARLLSADPHPFGVHLRWRERVSGVSGSDVFDRIILATGPDHARVTDTNPVLAAGKQAGLLAPDPLQLGVHTTADGRAVAPNGEPVAGLFIAGPLARGAVGELMGVPEVTTWAEHIARRVIRHLGLVFAG